MIRKPRSVRIAGWLALALMVGAVWVALSGAIEDRHSLFWATTSDWCILISLSGLYWLIGTLLHRSRLNRMRYTHRDKWE